MIERVLIAGAAAAGTALIVGTYAGSAIAMLVMATLAAVATVVVMWLADRHISADIVQLTRVTAPGSAMAEPRAGACGCDGGAATGRADAA